MELLIVAVLAIVAWMLWNGLRPPGATVKSSLERERLRRQRYRGDGTPPKLVLLLLPSLSVTLLYTHALASTPFG